MKILSLDTSSKNCSVSIVEILEDVNNINIISKRDSNDERTHSLKFMPLVNEIFKESGLFLDNIDLIVSCIGPGSFTGIRIGVSSSKAFIDTKKINAAAVSSLESLAYNEFGIPYVFSLIDAKNNNVYGGFFKFENNSYINVYSEEFDNIENILKKLKDHLSSNNINEITFVGDGIDFHKNIIEEYLKDIKINFSTNNIQNSISLAKAGFNHFKNGNYGDSRILNPIYLRKSQAERNANGES